MAETDRPISEGAALDAFLDELQREHEVRDIAGWDTGFANLNAAIDGIRPGLYLLIGRPSCGKTSFAKQLLDRVVMRNDALGVYFTFHESKKELRIKTLARLSGIESKEIRRGSAYLLHWYGVPRLTGTETEQLSPSWERVRLSAENARSWLDSVFLQECAVDTRAVDLEARVQRIRAATNKTNSMVVIDDCQRLDAGAQPLESRLPLVTEQLQSLAKKLNAALFAVWPDLKENSGVAPRIWGERALGADVVMVMEQDGERTRKLADPAQAVNIHIVKNRGGDRGTLSFEFQPACARFTEIV
jgi:replicative DNA helicase